MQFELDKLKGRIKEKKFTQENIAEYLEIASSTFSLKINGLAFFDQEEIQKMAKILEIPDGQYKEYFFTEKV